eukprot:GHVR01041635.1.p1 GENE.GHVR01041635.1~~GHVR01041635.1.p1  ORF type:complete len:158 (+),score=23.07 GHVR01041635.1:150-623(+)
MLKMIQSFLLLLPVVVYGIPVSICYYTDDSCASNQKCFKDGCIYIDQNLLPSNIVLGSLKFDLEGSTVSVTRYTESECKGTASTPTTKTVPGVKEGVCYNSKTAEQSGMLNGYTMPNFSIQLGDNQTPAVIVDNNNSVSKGVSVTVVTAILTLVYMN